jgi:hypothetical protein
VVVVEEVVVVAAARGHWGITVEVVGVARAHGPSKKLKPLLFIHNLGSSTPSTPMQSVSLASFGVTMVYEFFRGTPSEFFRGTPSDHPRLLLVTRRMYDQYSQKPKDPSCLCH